jgi:hypothetical protein
MSKYLSYRQVDIMTNGVRYSGGCCADESTDDEDLPPSMRTENAKEDRRFWNMWKEYVGTYKHIKHLKSYRTENLDVELEEVIKQDEEDLNIMEENFTLRIMRFIINELYFEKKSEDVQIQLENAQRIFGKKADEYLRKMPL